MSPERFAAADGRAIAYSQEGAGPPVLCLAGLTRNMADFADLARHLAPRFRVIRIDSRGRGASDRAVEPLLEYTLPVEAADALALLDHLGLSRAALIGTSRGGLIAMGLAARFPDRIAGIVLNDIGPAVERQGLEAIMGYVGREPEAPDFDSVAHALARAAAPAFVGVPHARWLAHARALFRDEGGRPRLSYDPRLAEAVRAQFEVPAPDLWPLWDALTATPVLAIRGANSDILSEATLAEMAHRRPDMVHVTLPDRGHVPFLDEPAALAAIDTFLAGLAP